MSYKRQITKPRAPLAEPRSLERELRLRSFAVLSRALPIVGLCYAAVGLLYLVAPPHEPARPFVLASTFAAALMMILWGLLPNDSKVSDTPFTLSTVIIGAAYALLLLFLSGDTSQAPVLILTLIGGGAVVAAPAVTALLAAITLAGWFMVGPSLARGDFVLWSFHLVIAAVIGGAITLSRRKWITRVHRRALQADAARKLASEQADKLARARDAALDSAQAKSRFLANVSHEVRTPLNAILGMLELIDPEGLARPQDEYLRQIKRSSTSLLAIVNDLLDLSKIEAGRMELESVAFDPIGVIEEVATNHAAAASAKDIELYTDIDPNTPDEVIGDPLRLRQVIANLVSNAIKFTDKGEVVISVRSVRRKNSRIELEFRVTDTGIGIAVDQQNKIFRPFSQADTSTSRQYGGTGLGLSICLQLVQLLGGQLQLQSRLGVGSSFYFRLQLELEESLSDSLVAVSAGLEGMRVLTIDANERVRTLLRSHLQGMGIEVSEASRFEAGLELLRKASGVGESFEVAIVDLRTFGTDWEAMAAQFAREATKSGCRVIAMGGEDHAWNRIIKSGISVRLLKPIQRARLLGAMLEALNQTSQPVPEPVPTNQSEPQLRLQDRLRKPVTILVAEDNDVNQRVIMAHLRKLGFNADSVKDGRQAVGALSNEHGYDIVLMDIEMPNMNGYEATAAIRERERQTGEQRIPIIALTAHAMQSDRQTALSTGMDDYLAKPYTSLQLRAIIEKWASARRVSQTGESFSDESEVLDRAVTAQLADLDHDTPGFLHEVVASFERTARENLEAMRLGVAKSDINMLRRAAHTAKGTSEQLGASRLGDVCRRLEQLESTASAGELVEAAEAEFKRAQTAFRAFATRQAAAS